MMGCNGCAGGNGGADVEVPLWIKPSLCWTRSRIVVVESDGFETIAMGATTAGRPRQTMKSQTMKLVPRGCDHWNDCVYQSF